LNANGFAHGLTGYAFVEKVIGHGVAFKNSQKTEYIEYLFESSGHPHPPQILNIHECYRSFAGATHASPQHALLFIF
jgi:hypothetical protein